VSSAVGLGAAPDRGHNIVSRDTLLLLRPREVSLLARLAGIPSSRPFSRMRRKTIPCQRTGPARISSFSCSQLGTRMPA